MDADPAKAKLEAGGQLVAQLLALGPATLRDASAILVAVAGEDPNAETADGLRNVGGRLAAIASFLEP